MNGAGWKRRDLLRVAAAVTATPLSGAWLREAKADADGTLTVALSDNPLTCDPINMVSHDTEILSQTIFENLVEFTIDAELRPQLAKALPTVSDDKLTYSFELRDDVFSRTVRSSLPRTSSTVSSTCSTRRTRPGGGRCSAGYPMSKSTARPNCG
jgi:ABC-type oligopeptide transport system substrate-binding subunit